MVEKEIEALLLEAHKAIEETARHAVGEIVLRQYKISYPPDENLTIGEQKALAELGAEPDLINALRKVFLDAAAYPVFHLFSVMDGVTDPQRYDGFWPGIQIGHRNEDDNESFLHDEFYASYERWRNQRTG